MNGKKNCAHRGISALFALITCVFLAFFVAVPAAAFAEQNDSASSSSSDNPYRDQAKAEKEAKEQEKAEQEAKANQEVVADAASDKPDGTYYGSAYGYQSLISVAVTVQDGMITDIKIVSHADDQSYVDLAMKETDLIIANQSTDVDTISGVTYSSTGILEATKDALSGDGAAAAMNSAWFGVLMIVLGLLLLAGAGVCAMKWLCASKRADRSRAMRIQQVFIQVLFFLMAPSAFASGFMGLKTLFMQIQVMQTQRGYDFELSTFTIFTIVFLLVIVVLGRFFCGYACAFGFAGDILYRARVAVTGKLGVTVPQMPEKLELVLRFVKYGVLVAVCVLVLAGFTMTINQESPWTAFSAITSLQFQRITLVGGLLLLVIAIGSLWKERFFCEFLCPLGALFSVIPTLPTGRMRRDREKCLDGCHSCRTNCPVHTEPKGKLLAGECIMCNRCAEGCPAYNAVSGLEQRFDVLEERAGQGDPAKFKRTVPELLMSRPVAVVWKALLLLVVFWLLHVTRFLPVMS